MSRYQWNKIRVLATGGQANIILFKNVKEPSGRLYIGKQALKPEYADYIKREHQILSRLVKSGFQHAVFEDNSGPGGYTSYRRYYEGTPLDELLADNEETSDIFKIDRYSAEKFISFAYKLSNLVFYLHEEIGIVHRDIKPKNVIYNEVGSVALIDLGISRKEGEVGEPEGTPGWSDPTQLRSLQPAKLTHDLYSLGKLFLWALGLEFIDSKDDLEDAIREGKIPKWIRNNKAITRFLQQCVDCISNNPNHRPGIKALLATLRRAESVGDRKKRVYEECPNPECGAPTHPKAPFCYHCLTPLLYEPPTGMCGICSKEIRLDRMYRHYNETHPEIAKLGRGDIHPTSNQYGILVCENCQWTTTISHLFNIHKKICKSKDKLLKPPSISIEAPQDLEVYDSDQTNPRALLAFSGAGIRFENLEVYRSLNIKFYEHQEDTVLRALRDLGGRCIIADSVGLGKTIECGIILRELIYRDQVQSILILVPSYELQNQWIDELEEKFDLGPSSNEGFRVWNNGDPPPKPSEKIITTYQCALDKTLTKEGDYSDRRTCDFFVSDKMEWDAIIVDEAHELGLQHTGKRWQQIYRINPRFLFLVTATPIRRDPINLYPLIRAVDPILAGDQSKFAKSYQRKTATAQDLRQLKGLLSQVMIRHTRGDVPSIQFPKRKAQKTFVQLESDGKALEKSLRILIQQEGEVRRIAKLLYSKFRCSIGELVEYMYRSDVFSDTGYKNRRYLKKQSQYRALVAVKNAYCDLLTITERIWDTQKHDQEDPKIKVLFEILSQHFASTANASQINETVFLSPSYKIRNKSPVLIFTGSNSGRDFITEALQKKFRHLRIEGFDDNMSGDDRINLIREYNHGEIDALVCATAQSRGLNLQYGSILVNMDLPINPVELEQRIGRVQRLAQDKPIVHIVNIMYDMITEKWLWEGYKDYMMMFQEVLGDTDLISIFTVSDAPKKVSEIYDAILEGELDHRMVRQRFEEAAKAIEDAEELAKAALRTESDDDDNPIIPSRGDKH